MDKVLDDLRKMKSFMVGDLDFPFTHSGKEKYKGYDPEIAIGVKLSDVKRWLRNLNNLVEDDGK